MAKRNKTADAKELASYKAELESSPEWAGYRTGPKTLIVYLFAMLCGLGLCICTLYVLLS